jgi:tmRNA-binding protein
LSTTFDFSFHERYILLETGVMLKLKKDRVFLLKELRSLVTAGLERSDDRRQSRKLRIMRREVDKWITEMKEPTNEPVAQS